MRFLVAWFCTITLLFGSFNDIIIDDANILHFSPKLQQEYTTYNTYMLQQFDIDVRVLTTNSQEDINLFGHKMFKLLKKHTRTKSGRMVLFILNPRQDKARLEVAKALEGVYTDGFVSYIERKGIVPYFQASKLEDGVFMVMELLKDKALQAKKEGAFSEAMNTQSLGAGAKTKAKLHQRDQNAKKGDQVSLSQNDTPKEVLRKYLQVLRTHNKKADLDIYTKTTQAFFANWVVTEINQDHEATSLKRCIQHYTTLFDTPSTHAVLAVTPYDKHRKCAPYFFKKENNTWKLDIATMAQTIRFNTQMQWHFDLSKRLQNEGIYYAFAFDGYGFDNNGYPFLAKKKTPYRWGFSCGNWAYPQEQEMAKQDPQKYRCWINNYTYGKPANVRLGLDVYDYILGVRTSTQEIHNITKK